ncbi:hypothetical protein [Streptosporangium sp. NBC_01469]|uniref:hypothetical protein n=1 Tax=Streptosporangium sp. NBC_01469 TaxID=2903898 RepID=UPI002E2D68A5|nr:hypothetical protein [Streptosporangium sp. NBC_01469]
METEDGKRLDAAVQESAEVAISTAASMRADAAGMGDEIGALLETLADEVDDVAAELLTMRDQIPAMEAESLYLTKARAEAEERGEQVPAPGTVEAEEWEAVRLRDMPSPGGQAPGWGAIQ